jgi:hypothetical protein
LEAIVVQSTLNPRQLQGVERSLFLSFVHECLLQTVFSHLRKPMTTNECFSTLEQVDSAKQWQDRQQATNFSQML